ncbi:MAG: BNR-repeat neuraminidase N-terminal domain-containing protein [Bacteroidales bacterium]|nr:BNR-repeat neuraminidase N-terminal domain-containing protein [Bacteroidales bacterium]
MKRIFTFLIALQLMAVFSFFAGTNSVRAVGEEYNMPKKDGHSGTKEVDGYLTFYDMGGPTGDAPRDYTGAICFVPKNAGEQIEISFETFDLTKAADAKVYIYDGEIEYPKYNAPIPENPVAVLSNNDGGSPIRSTTGKLSVLYYYKSASYSDPAAGAGWKATVKSLVPSDMSYLGISGAQSGIISAYPGKKNQTILSVNIQAHGSYNPLSITSLTFDLTGTTSLSDLSNVRVYYTGANSSFSASVLFGEAIVTPVQSITLPGTQELSSGDNYFWLVADVNADATPNHKIDAACSSAVIGGEEKVTTPLSPEGDINIDNMVLMPSVATTYNVGSEPISFYDDGGKEGNITQNFTGKVTFKPATPGKKVQITFNALNLFNTSSTGLNDVLKIYNGIAVDEAQLNRTLLKEATPLTIKSTSADGALTITLKSVAGYPKAGFEAVVEEFEPQAMTVKEIVTAQSVTGTVAAGDELQPILSLNIATENTEPALTAQKFTFTTEGTTNVSDLTKATLYYTGRNASFTDTVRVGETVLNNSATFSITCSRELAYGDNYFWLTYDLATTATTGSVVDAGCSVTEISSVQHNIATVNPEGNRAIKNEYVSKVGTYERTVSGVWSYTHQPRSYGAGYEPVIGDQIVTFVPATSGNIIELDFSSFSVYYASSSYSTRATFKVYSGREQKSDNLLWELSSNEDQEKGPGKILRSAAADGSLTIVFNANTTYSSYVGKGWQAEVREYKSRPTQVDQVVAFQDNAKILKPGSKDQDIIGFVVSTGGDLSPLTLTDVVLNLKGSETSIDRVSIYYTGKDSAFSSSDLWGETSEPATSVTLKGNVVLPEGKSYFWVAYDMKSMVESDVAIDAALTSLQIGGTKVVPVTGDPEGVRVTKNIIELQSGDNGVVTIDKPILFYDDGGSEGKFSLGFNGNITFAPAREGEKIKIIFNSFSVGTTSNYPMTIYNGAAIDEDSLNVKVYGSTLPKPVVSTASDGKLTVHFKSSTLTYQQKDGWEAQVLSYVPQSLKVTEVTDSVVAPAEVLRGAGERAMVRVAVKVEGDKDRAKVEKISFTAPDMDNVADIKSATVYYTGTFDVFAANEQFGESRTSSPFVFEGEKYLTEAGTYYFWLAYEIAGTAVAGNKITAQAESCTADGTAFSLPSAEKGESTVKRGFSGTYTVGTSGSADYEDIASAVAAMEGGIDGPVVLQLESGDYEGKFLIPHIEGASAENTITIRSKSGNAEDVKIFHNRYVKPDYGVEDNGIFTVYGTDYLTIEGITFSTEDLTYRSVLNVKKVSRHVTIRNCRFTAPLVTDYTYGQSVKFIYMESASEANQNSDFITIENNTFEGGYLAIDAGGTGTVNPVSLPKEKGARIINNSFKNQGSKSIYVRDEIDLVIEGNTIFNDYTQANTFDAIDLARCYDNLRICNNRITLAAQSNCTAIECRPMLGTPDAPAYIYNNEINFTSTYGEAYALMFSEGMTVFGCTDIVVAHNTIRMAGSAPTSAVVFFEDASSGVQVINNLFQNEAGGFIYRLNSANYTKGLTFGNNALSIAENAVFAYAGADVADLAAWRAIAVDENSIMEKADFYSDENLDLKSAGNLNMGQPLDFAATDINGSERSKQKPTVGAYEYQIPTEERPAMSDGYPTVARVTYNSIEWKVKANQSGKVFFLAQKSGEEVPSMADVMAADSADIIKDKEMSVSAKDLDSRNSYKGYFVLRNNVGIESLLIEGPESETDYRPTAVSTFEDVAEGNASFEDGTAAFEGFTVEAVTDGIEGSTKAAKISDEKGVITLTNTAEGLTVNGFYLLSDASLEIKAFKQSEENSKTVEPTDGEWIFCNLRDMQALTKIELSSTGNVWIDNFSGTPQELTLSLKDTTVNQGVSVTIEPEVEGGVVPYTYEWKNEKQEVVSTERSFTLQPECAGEYTLTVTDGWKNANKGAAVITVLGEAVTATFENLYLAPESYWQGNEYSPTYTSKFYSGSYSFTNSYVKEMRTWGGFAYSNETSTDFDASQYLTQQFRSAAGGGVDGSENYAVVYTTGDPTTVSVLNNPEGDSIRGVYVTNSAWVKDATDNGDNMTDGAFAQGDWFKLTAEGTDNAGRKHSAEFYLADFRSTDAGEHYSLSTWEWFDLSPLGKVKSVRFKLSGSRSDDYGMTTPAYFCMDNFNGVITENKADTVEANLESAVAVQLNLLTSFDVADGTIRYAIEEEADHTIANARIDQNELRVSGSGLGETSLLISAVQRGRKEFIRVPVNVKDYSGIDSPEYGNVQVYPVPAYDVLNVKSPFESYSIEILSMSGQQVQAQEGNSSHAVLDVSGLEPGTYFIRLNNGENVVTKRFTKIR